MPELDHAERCICQTDDPEECARLRTDWWDGPIEPCDCDCHYVDSLDDYEDDDDDDY